MKKILSIFALVLAFVITGCNNGSGDNHKSYFKEYTFVGTASAEQLTKINEGLKNNVTKISSIKSKSESYSKSGSTKISGKSESTVKFLEDSSNPDLFISYSESSSSSDSKSNGETLNRKTKSESKRWDSGKKYVFTIANSTTNGEKQDSDSVYTMDEATKSKTYKENAIKGYYGAPDTNATYYLNSDGSFTVINSNIQKSVSAVQWGSETKEYITSSKSQTVYAISKDYQLTSYYTYEEQKANRDPQTNEWFSSEQLISMSYSLKEYKYGKRESASVSSLNNSIANKTFVTSVVANYHTATLTGASPTYTVNETNSQSGAVSLSYVSSSNNIYQYRFNSTLSGNYGSSSGYNAFRFDFEVKTLKGAGSETTQKCDFALSSAFTNSFSGNDQVEVVETHGYVYFVNKEYSSIGVRITVSFDGSKALVQSLSQY